jgi:hypothetical protein
MVGNLIGLSHDEGRPGFTKNLSESLFNECLSIDTTYSQIHLDG